MQLQKEIRDDSHQPVVFENNTFQGVYSKTILKVQNTTNVYISSTAFRNVFGSLTLLQKISGILCHNSQIELHDIRFQNVLVFPNVDILNCTLTIQNLEILDTDFTPFSSPITLPLLNIQYSKAIIENSSLKNNTKAHCFGILGGNITLQNMNIIGNKIGHLGFFFVAAKTMLNVYNIVLSMNEGGPLFVVESNMSIIDSIFEGNRGKTVIFIDPKSETLITISSFLLNGDRDYLIETNSTSEEKNTLKIESCKFERNIVDESMIHAGSGRIFIDNSTFNYNRNVLKESKGSADFTNCVFTRNYATRGGVAQVFSGSLQFVNCSFNNNTASLDAGFLLVHKSEVALYGCSVVNNSASSEAGAISLSEYSSLTLENSIFENNSCGLEGGAIRVSGKSNLTVVNNIFRTNSALSADGGAIFLEDGSRLETNNCQFIANTAAHVGGAVVVADNSSFNDTGSTFTNNNAESKAGAIFVFERTSLLLENSIFEANSCELEGGAIKAHRKSILTFYQSTIINNKALRADGGAVIVEDESRLETDSCEFIGNTAALGGGAVMVLDHSFYTDTGSTFINNTVADNGKLSIRFKTAHEFIFSSNLSTIFSGGATSVHDHSVLIARDTKFTGNKVETPFDSKYPYCPPGECNSK